MQKTNCKHGYLYKTFVIANFIFLYAKSIRESTKLIKMYIIYKPHNILFDFKQRFCYNIYSKKLYLCEQIKGRIFSYISSQPNFCSQQVASAALFCSSALLIISFWRCDKNSNFHKVKISVWEPLLEQKNSTQPALLNFFRIPHKGDAASQNGIFLLQGSLDYAQYSQHSHHSSPATSAAKSRICPFNRITKRRRNSRRVFWRGRNRKHDALVSRAPRAQARALLYKERIIETKCMQALMTIRAWNLLHCRFSVWLVGKSSSLHWIMLFSPNGHCLLWDWIITHLHGACDILILLPTNFFALTSWWHSNV